MTTPETQPLTVTTEVLANLHAPTPATARKTRQGPGGKMLTYVDARYVMQVLDTEVGPENWQDEYAIGPGGKVGCRIGIKVGGFEGEWVWKGDGAGETDIEGEKGSFSDAFKRAAVKWGIARDLYDEKPQSQGQATPSGAAVPPVAASAPASPQAVSPQPAGDAPEFDPPTCPNHGYPWTVGQYGPYCRSKAREGEAQNARGYCSLKPAA